MSKHLERDLANLKKDLLGLGTLVEESINMAMNALLRRDETLVREVMDHEYLVDEREVQIEEECLKLLALHQPVAGDLRFIVAVLKVNSDLERMGDLAFNIAKRAKYLCHSEPLSAEINFEEMVSKVRAMVRLSLDALVNQDVALAKEVCSRDDEVDRINKQMYNDLKQLMRDDPNNVERAVDMLSASRHLERIGDLATNIAEDIIFMVEGEVIRHGAWL